MLKTKTSKADAMSISSRTTAATTTTAVGDFDLCDDVEFSPPTILRANRTYVLRDSRSGRALMLRDGLVVLAHPDGHGSVHWRCSDHKGWLGFRNVVSSRFLGHDMDGSLRCTVDEHLAWEKFCFRPTGEQGRHVLLMTHWDALWHVGAEEVITGQDQKTARLVKVEDASDAIAWEFLEVQSN